MTKNHSQRKGINIQGTRKRRKLLEASGEAFSKMGYEGTTIRDIADIAKVQPSALIYHFDNKKNLFYATLRHHVQENKNLKSIFEPLEKLDNSATEQSLADAIFATTKNILTALFGPKGKIPYLRGLLITMLIDGDKFANHIIQEFGVNSMAKADEILKVLRPNLTHGDLFWARHLYWSMVFYSVVCQQLLLARTKEKKYTQEFIYTYALRMTRSYCSRFNLPAPDGSENWVYNDITE